MAGKGATARDEFAALRTIGEVAEHLDLPQHVLRFWETRFKEIDPVKRAGGRRFYRPRDIALVEAIRHLLYREGYTIKGVQRILKEQGVDAVIADVRGRQKGEPAPPTPAPPLNVEPSAPEPTLFDLEPARDCPEPKPSAPAASEEAIPPDAATPDAPREREYPVIVAPVFNAPVVIPTGPDAEQMDLLRQALAEIEECKRLLTVTRR